MPDKLQTDARSDIMSCLRRWRQRLLWQRFLYTLAAGSVLVFIARLFAVNPGTLAIQLIVLVVVWFTQLLLSNQWRRLTPENFLQHLNRRIPELEESAQLLLQDEKDLKSLQSLQRQRVQAVYKDELARISLWQTRPNYRQATALFAGCLLLAVFSNQLRHSFEYFLTSAPQSSRINQTGKAFTGITAVSVLYLRGVTINMMIITGLIIALGVIIDDAIVDIDNIARDMVELVKAVNGKGDNKAYEDNRRGDAEKQLI